MLRPQASPRPAPPVIPGGWGWRWSEPGFHAARTRPSRPRAPRAGRAPGILLILALSSLASACGPSPAASATDEPAADSAGEPAAFPPFVVLGRWPDASRLTWFADPAGGPLSPAVLRAAVASGAAAWSEAASPGTVGFVETEDRAAADVVFRWGPSEEERDAGLFARDTSIAVMGPIGPGCEVVFDAARAWREAGGDGPSFERAARHEIGHVLGLGHVELARSLMHPQWEVGPGALGDVDRAGLHSLYGGGEDGAGDLFIEREPPESGAPIPALRRVAPPERTAWEVFDTDGDGGAEVVVWDVGADGLGAWMSYHFGPGPRLERTVGPYLGIAGPDAQVELVTGAQGERFLDVRRPGAAVRRQLDSRGIPGEPRPLAPRGAAPPVRGPGETRRADLDGDGVPERVRRAGPR